MAAVRNACESAGVLLPLLHAPDPARTVAFDGRRRVAAAAFMAEVRSVAAALPAQRHAINLCDDRYAFLLAFCAAALRGQTSLLPHSRAPAVVAEMLARFPDSYCVGERPPESTPPRFHRIDCGAGDGTTADTRVDVAADHLVAIGFTSGSTGEPTANRKPWRSFHACTQRNAAVLQALLAAQGLPARADVVATVPPQHMYGMELSVLLPLLADMAVHTGRPFYPADVAAALAEAQAPRLLVTTPVHLRALLESGVTLPPLAGIVTATAPLPQPQARAAEQRFGAPVQELFGSTETCVIAHRRTALASDWTLHADIELAPRPDGTDVHAPWYDAPVPLQDVVELLADGRFALRGRSSDLVEIAGKRASLGELGARLLAVPGMRDAVVFQSEQADGAGVRRIVALVVAPGMDAAGVLDVLRRTVDPVFLPRPLRLVDALPRNETGKLTRAALLEALRAG